MQATLTREAAEAVLDLTRGTGTDLRSAPNHPHTCAGEPLGQTGYVIWRLDWPKVQATLGMVGLLPLDRDTLDGLTRMADGVSEALNAKRTS